MSRDIKGTSLNELNDGLERAIARLNRNLTAEIDNSEVRAINAAARNTAQQISSVRNDFYRRIEKTQIDMKERIECVQKSLGAKIDRQAKESAQQLTELDKRHTTALKNLSNSMFDVLEKQNQKMTTQISRVDKNIGILSDELKRMDVGMHELEAHVDQRFKLQQKQIEGLCVDVQHLFEVRQTDTNNKLLAAGQALAILEAVRERTDVRRFAPQSMQDKVSLLEQRLRSINRNPDLCTISDANNLMDLVIVMENEAIREQLRWEAKHKTALTVVNALLCLMQDSMQLKVDSIYDETQQEELQTNYWTHGEYGKINQHIEQLKQKIESGQLGIQELDAAIEQVKILEKQAEALRNEAVQKGILSESRVAVSNDILNAMLGQGWELKDEPGYLGGDEDEDPREGTFAIIRKAITGEELSILILPEEKDGKLGNRIVFHRNDDRIEAPGAFQTRMEQIKREIEKSGHKLGEIGEPCCGGDGKILQLKNGRNLKKNGAADELNRTLNNRR